MQALASVTCIGVQEVVVEALRQLCLKAQITILVAKEIKAAMGLQVFKEMLRLVQPTQ